MPVRSERLDVSPEFAILHRWPIAADLADGKALAIILHLAAGAPVVHVADGERLAELDGQDAVMLLTLLVDPAILCRLGAAGLAGDGGASYHLPSPLRTILLESLESDHEGEARIVYTAAKGMEMLCALVRLDARSALVPIANHGALSLGDAERLMAARRMIDDRCHEKLTLDMIARACGLNRSKLSRGFRAMFDCSVADAIAEKRLDQARQLLLTTDMLVSSVGYRAGYLNNASFTRAFARRFGVSPSDLRSMPLAA